MLIPPCSLSTSPLDKEELKADKKNALRFESCALGKRAIYVGGLFLGSIYYAPLHRVKRVYKRLAVSKGFYEGKVYGTLAYLVVQYNDGMEKTCRFEHEEALDNMLSAIRNSTKIPVGKR